MKLPLRYEVICRKPIAGSSKPPLLFVHGATHAAWCWDEYWLPAAADRGWPCYAISLRGHGGSEGRSWLHLNGLNHYIEDVLHLAHQFRDGVILVGHSMGGLIVQQCLRKYSPRAAVLVASVPPWGAMGTVWRLIRQRPWNLIPLATGLGRNPLMRREFLFSDEVPPVISQKFVQRIQPESLRALYGMALPRRAIRTSTSVMVMGASRDGIVPPRTVRQTARAYGSVAHIFRGLGHELMLETRWREPLDAMLDELETRVAS